MYMEFRLIWLWQGADVFLETERKDYRMSGPEERQHAVELYFTTPPNTAPEMTQQMVNTAPCVMVHPALVSQS